MFVWFLCLNLAFDLILLVGFIYFGCLCWLFVVCVLLGLWVYLFGGYCVDLF